METVVCVARSFIVVSGSCSVERQLHCLPEINEPVHPERTNEPFARLIVELGRSPRSALGWGSASLARIVLATQTRFLSSARLGVLRQ